MSAFLWVEDFDGGTDETLQVTTDNVFGLPPDNNSNDWTDVLDLRDYLAKKRIFLETSLVDALNFLADPQKLASIDYVILDIDLRISADPADEKENSYLKNLLHLHESDNLLNKYLVPRFELKKIAGYHLWTRLVINHGFPRDRIQFCSNHGGYLKTIRESFTNARIQPPDVFKKGDGKIKDWITEQSNQSYTALRRNVIDNCSLILKQLKNDQCYLPEMLRLSTFPGPSTKDFKRGNAIEMLEMLPLYLPPIIADENETAILRAFIRAFSMEWERFNPSKDRMKFADEDTKNDFSKRLNDFNNNKSIKSAATVLKFLRNTFSHGSNPIDISCYQAEQFFLLNIRVIFYISEPNELDAIEKQLLPKFEVDDIGVLAEAHNKSMQRSLEHAAYLAKSPKYVMSDVLRSLQLAGNSDFYKDALKLMSSMLWHELTSGFKNRDDFHSEFRRISESNDPVHRVAMACVKGSTLSANH